MSALVEQLAVPGQPFEQIFDNSSTMIGKSPSKKDL